MLPPPSEDTRIAELMRRMDNLESALRAAFTTISGGRGLRIVGGGGITVEDGGQLRVLYPASEGGGVGVYFGDLDAAGEYVGTGLLVQAPDGSDIASFRSDAASGIPLAVIRDGQQNAVFFTDTGTGVGLGRPYLPFVFYGARFSDAPSLTTSSTFETLWQAFTYKQHAAVYVAAASAADAGVAGEVRVLVNGAQLGSTQSVSPTAAAHAFGPAPVAGAHMLSLQVQIQARVASGSGSLRVFPQVGTGMPL